MTDSRTALLEVGERVKQQLDAIEAFTRHAEVGRRLEEQRAVSREMRRDVQHRLDALRRAQQALLARADLAVEQSVDLLRSPKPLALVVHRNEWMSQKLCQGLRAMGAEVLPACADGADGLGVAVAEQPDLVILEDRLPSMSGLELLAGLQEFCTTLVAAQVAVDDDLGRMLDAGATAVFSRRVPPAQVLEEVQGLVFPRARRGLRAV